MLALGMIILGLIVLVGSAHYLVKAAVAFANNVGVSPMLIGLTIVAFGTSAPELVVAIRAALDGQTGIVIGTAIGSNIANILLLLGVTGIFGHLIIRQDNGMKRDIIGLILMSALYSALLLYGFIPSWVGAVLLITMIGYLWFSYAHEKRLMQEDFLEEIKEAHYSTPLSLFILLLGLAGVVGGAEILVNGAIDAATQLGVSKSVIALTIIAFGTSSPELITMIMAVRHKQSDVGLGGIIGSNMMNLMIVLSAGIMIHPIAVDGNAFRVDLAVMMAATLTFAAILWRCTSWPKPASPLFFLIYCGYVGWLYA